MNQLHAVKHFVPATTTPPVQTALKPNVPTAAFFSTISFASYYLVVQYKKMGLLTPIACLVLLTPFATAQTSSGKLAGRITDPVPAPLGNTIIRLLSSDGTTERMRTMSREDGTYVFSQVSPGTYTVEAWAPGFRRQLAANQTVQAGETTWIATLVLSLSDCDAPSTMCDDFGLGHHTRIKARGYALLPLNCMVNLESGKVACPSTSRSQHAQADIQWTSHSGASPSITPGHQSRLANLDDQAKCGSATYRDAAIRTSGLGLGYEFCVRTRSGHFSHVYIVNDLRPGASELALYYVTR